MRVPLLIAAASRPRRLREQRPDRQYAECRREPDRREYRLQRRDRDRCGHRRRRQHGRRRRHELRQSRCRAARDAVGNEPPKASTTGAERPARAERLSPAPSRRRPRTRTRYERPVSLGQPDHLVRLERQAPLRPLHRQRDRRRPVPPRDRAQSIGCTRKWSKPQLSSSAGSIPCLRPHQLQLIALRAGPRRCRPWG